MNPNPFEVLDVHFAPQVDAERARVSALPEGIAILTVFGRSAVPKRLAVKGLIACLDLWRRPDRLVFAQPLNLFLSQVKFSVKLRKMGLLESATLHWPGVTVIRTSNASALADLILLPAEGWAFIFESRVALAIENLRQASIRANGQYMESEYVPLIRDHEAFVFFQETHLSFEVFGSAEDVKKTFLSPLLEKINP